MKRKILSKINVLLGTISLALAGCHTQKSATNGEYGVVALYGVQVDDYRPVVTVQAENTAKADSVKPVPQLPDTAQARDKPHRNPQIMAKYGVMIPRD